MILKKASYKAMKYACLKFHYAKRIPAQPMVGYSVFNKKNEWCGCIIYNNGIGAIEKPFGLQKGKVCELVRMALNGKQEKTSKCLSLSIKKFKKENKLVEMIVSYADSDEGHNGTIYKATNWFYVGSHKTGDKYICPTTGKDIHSRSHSAKGYNKQFGVYKKVYKTSDLIRIKKGVKHKFVYPLTKDMRTMCNKIKKEYIKNASIA
tara:strand:+ start:556 stop:1173 length:618 start_codon:yes stop_codon:yes gene_type:complete